VTGKTIVYLPNWLGDMVMATPFLQALRTFLDGELWAVGKGNAIHIYNGLEIFDRFIALESKGLVDFLDLVTLIRTEGFKRSFALPHSFRSALVFYAAGVKERIGYARNSRGFMLTRQVEEADGLESTVEHYLRIIESVGGKRLLDAPLLLVGDDEEQKFDTEHLDIQKPFAAFITGAQYGPSKCWIPEYFSRLADMIAEKYDMKIYLLPGKGEEALARKIREGAARQDHVDIKSMDVLGLKVCLSRASLVVSNDTGPRHIAVALSAPTIVLTGPMDERYTRYPNPHGHPVYADVPCRPCNKKKCDRDHECMRNIRPEEVFVKVEELLG
jgi:heptosyltransferase-2